jgi:restriction system protein
LKALGGSGTNEEILDKVCELEKYPAEVQQVQHTDQQQTAINYRLAWAKTYLKRVGALDNSDRGVWTLTEKGAALTEKDCEKIPAEVRKAAYLKRKTGLQKEKGAVEEGEDDTAQELSWRETLLSTLLGDTDSSRVRPRLIVHG